MKKLKLHFTGETEEVMSGIEILSRKLNFEINNSGYEVKVISGADEIRIFSGKTFGEIQYMSKHSFFRALGIFTEHFMEETVITEKPALDMVGVMFDSSRNAVMTVDAFKNFINDMSLMGYNMAMLYTEDTYEVKEYPYFGYMRGRYTYDELKECDDYADIFGIEVIPCIQTLGHLRRALKWNHGADIKDTDDILFVGSDDTYKFIQALMKAATSPFRSNRIHLGLDEAHGIGLGAYLRRNGYTPASELLREHCTRVMKIAEEMGLKPMIWADMYFRVKSTSGNYYEDLTGEFTEDDRKNVPANASLVYWDYYKETNEEYRELMRLHKQLSNDVIFAGSVWCWSRLVTSYRKTFATMIPAVEECISNNIKEAFITMWGDDGNEASVMGNLYGIQLFAELCYGHSMDIEYMDKRFFACTGGCGEYFRSLDLLDDFGQEAKAANPSKCLLWQDPMLGLYDKQINIDNISHLYGERKKALYEISKKTQIAKELFYFAYCVSDVLELKADLGINLKKSYDKKDNAALLSFADEVIPELKKRVARLHRAYRRMWYATYKSFGFEEIERRLGGLLARLDATARRIKDYINGRIEAIEELEEERLPINPAICGLEFTELSYKRLITGND